MKKLLAMALMLAIAASCEKHGELFTEGNRAPMLTASTSNDEQGGVRTTITVDDEGVGTIWWKPGDLVSIFIDKANVKYFSLNTENATTAIFDSNVIIGSTESSSSGKWGLYPYDAAATCDGSSVTTTIPAAQNGVPETFDDKLFPMLAHSFTNEMTFYNVCGGIKFSLSRDDIKKITFKGNNDENLAGKVKLTMDESGRPSATAVTGEKTITLTPKTGSCFAKNTNYYLVMLPVVLTNGFTMTFETENQIGTFNYSEKAVTISRSKFGRKASIDSYATFVDKPEPAIDLSASGTANCYIVSEKGTYKFKAVQGNSNTSVGDVKGIKVLWETFGTDVAPSVGDLVKADVSYADNYITFSTNDTFKEGNAVIAAYSDDKCTYGKVLWSWHIWLTDQPEEQVYNNNAGTMMDRNLGATSVTPGDVHALGLLYQWGRKDPFMGGNAIDSSTPAASTVTWPSMVSSTSSTGTISYVVKHPTTFITDQNDWYYPGIDTTLWQRSDKPKGIYDPCPIGWRVPDGDSNGVWSKAFGVSDFWELSPGDGINCGLDFGKTERKLGTGAIWYPNAGYIAGYSSLLTNVGGFGHYWACKRYCNFYCYYYISSSYGRVYPVGPTACLANAYSVRCLKEQTK